MGPKTAYINNLDISRCIAVVPYIFFQYRLLKKIYISLKPRLMTADLDFITLYTNKINKTFWNNNSYALNQIWDLWQCTRHVPPPHIWPQSPNLGWKAPSGEDDRFQSRAVTTLGIFEHCAAIQEVSGSKTLLTKHTKHAYLSGTVACSRLAVEFEHTQYNWNFLSCVKIVAYFPNC